MTCLESTTWIGQRPWVCRGGGRSAEAPRRRSGGNGANVGGRAGWVDHLRLAGGARGARSVTGCWVGGRRPLAALCATKRGPRSGGAPAPERCLVGRTVRTIAGPSHELIT